MKILISGFKPFNNEYINPALMIIEQIDKFYLDNEIITLELDVEYNNDSIKLLRKINEVHPDLVLCIGQAGGRKKVMIENYALNMQSASIPDNANLLYEHHEISKNGVPCYQTNIDVLKLKDKVNSENFGISYHAGTFICNEIYYSALDFINSFNLDIKCGFIHVPYIKEQVINKANMPYLEFNEILNIIYKIIEAFTNV